MDKIFSIAIDGPAGAGKSTIARAAAEELEITLDDDIVNDYGVYQGAWENAREDGDFSAKMYFMWDENALYICEVRSDDYVELAGNGKEPWNGSDSNLIFLQAIDGGTDGNKEAWSHHIFYIAGNGSSQYGGDAWVRINNGSTNAQETVKFDEIKIATAATDDGFCVEVMVPWTVLQDKIAGFKPAEGVEMGMSMVPIDYDAGAEFAQLSWFKQADAMGIAGGYDFGGWATLKLGAAPVVETVDTAEDAVTTAPQTFDPMIVAAIGAIAAAAGYAVSKKR